jgi:superfamily II DNA or RNA helicase
VSWGYSMTDSSLNLAIQMRFWQSEALTAWHNAGDRGVVAVVTGGGKTWFALACVLDLLKRHPDTAVVIVVPTVALLDQWVVVLTDDLGVPPEDIAMFGGGRRPTRPRLFNVMVINTARSIAPTIAAERPTFLIIDECHRAASLHNALSLRGDHVATLGLSATPERDFDDRFSEVVVPVLGPVIYRYDYAQALADRVITPFDLTNVHVPLSLDEQAKYNNLTRRLVPMFRRRERGEAVDDRLHRLLRDRARVSTGAEMRIPAAIKILEGNKRTRAIVFHEQIAAADIIARVLLSRGHRAAVYHSGIGQHVRQDNLRLFRRGEVDVLVTCRALDEGINVPDASLAVIVASTASTRQRIQRLGRVLRPAQGKERAQIFTVYASEPEAERLRQEEAGLEGVNAVAWQTFSGAA